MFYYLNPGFRDDLGHHMTHQTILHRLYGDEFCVLGSVDLKINDLPYNVIKCLQSNTWQYLSSNEIFGQFELGLIDLKKFLKEGDTVFMYMSDVQFIYPLINAINIHGLKGKFILNLFHSGQYLTEENAFLGKLGNLLSKTKTLRQLSRIHLMVETERLQLELKKMTGETFPILPMFHSMDFKKSESFENNEGKPIISFLSASKPRGLKQFVDLIDYISLNNPALLSDFIFKIRISQQTEENIKMIEGITDKIQVLYGNVSYAEYQQLVSKSYIMLMPYLSSHFYANTSGVYSDSVMNEKPVVTTINTWLGDHTLGLNTGTTFREGDAQDFYMALKKVIDNYAFYKKGIKAAKESWALYHSPENLNHMLSSFEDKSFLGNGLNNEGLLEDAKGSQEEFQILYFGSKKDARHRKRNLLLKAKMKLKRILNL